MTSSTDRAGRIQEQWERERPDLDASSIGVVTRIWQLAKVFGERRRELLRSHDIEPALMDLLGTLRRSGEPYALTTRQLAERSMVTPAAISQRLSRAEKQGWVARAPGGDRTTLVTLLPAGKSKVDATAGAIFEADTHLLAALDASERDRLAALLEALGASIDPGGPLPHVGDDPA